MYREICFSRIANVGPLSHPSMKQRKQIKDIISEKKTLHDEFPGAWHIEDSKTRDSSSSQPCCNLRKDVVMILQRASIAKKKLDVRRTSDGRRSVVRRTSIGHPSDVCRTSVGLPSDVRQTSDGRDCSNSRLRYADDDDERRRRRRRRRT